MTLKNTAPELCTTQQTICPFYTPQWPVGFEDMYLPNVGSCFSHNTADHYILFVLGGKIALSFFQYQDKPVVAGEMLFMPRNMNFHGRVIGPAHLLLLKFNDVRFPCLEERIRRLIKKKAEGHISWDRVLIKAEMSRIIEDLIHYREQGLACSHIYLIKTHEIYLVLKHFYTDEERARFCYPFIGYNPDFTESVIANYTHSRTAEQLAACLGYGIKTFRKQFKINFGVTPYKWMQQQMAIQIRSKLMKKEIPLKQIMAEYGFMTTSHFIIFCRKHFGGTPMEIRNGKVPEIPPLVESGANVDLTKMQPVK